MKIAILDPLVAERIAAGEVVERPASVVKELVENSLDAGATEIAVVLEQGGRQLIEVIDNGCGMSPSDLKICWKRHATSKLREVEDLDTIATLGFRGEALPSVAAVSQFSIISRDKDSKSAHEMRDDKISPVTFGHFLGATTGTRVRAESLFAEIPARLKFLKTPRSEVSHTKEWLERLAMTHPEVGFKLSSDDRKVLELRPQSEEDRVRAVLAPGSNYPIKTATNDNPEEAGVRVRIHWLEGFSSPQSRRLVQVVNGRALRDKFIQSAILTPFRQALLPGQFPGLALLLDVDPGMIDVNVHPTKTEVRFLNNRIIFKEIKNTIESLLARDGFSVNVPASRPRTSLPVQEPLIEKTAPTIPAATWQASEPPIRTEKPQETWLETPTLPSSELVSDPEMPRPPLTPRPSHPLTGSRYIGTLFNTYLLFDLGDELGMIDQHAADERIRYEKLRKTVFQSNEKPKGQALLIPETVQIDPSERSDLEARIPWIEKLGFEAEIFGEASILFRSIPEGWQSRDLKPRLANLVERLKSLDSPQSSESELIFDDTLFEKLASEACHSAVRAGDNLRPIEALALVDSLFACEHPWNCPHGRPCFVRVAQGRVEEWFQRRVN